MTTSDPAAFCGEIRDRLVRSLTLYCGDRVVAEELAQEALVRVWERWPKVSAMDAPEAWTFRTALNLANSSFRRKQAERRARHRLEQRPVPPAPPPDDGTADEVRAAVRALPPRQRAVIIARYFLDLDVAQTATLLDCAPGTVKAATHQAINRLRQTGLIDDDVEVPAT